METLLPATMDQFWGASANKLDFQANFIDFVLKTVTSSKTIYLGGGVRNNNEKCMRKDPANIETVSFLQSNIEEADDRILLHVNHCVVVDKYTRVIVASSDTDVYITLLYQLQEQYTRSGLKELWIMCGAKHKKRTIPLHLLMEKTNSSVIRVLPAMHALTGCDTTSKFGTKPAALKKCSNFADLLIGFGSAPITEDMMVKSETFLVEVMGGHGCKTMDELRYFQFHHKKKNIDFDNIVPPSSSVKFHILRAYFQCRKWIKVLDNLEELNPLLYGYEQNEDGLRAVITENEILPPDFPHPCTCGKCAREYVCPCRKMNSPCCAFCKCCAGDDCKNTHNIRTGKLNIIFICCPSNRMNYIYFQIVSQFNTLNGSI
jgi:hypothetical protein